MEYPFKYNWPGIGAQAGLAVQLTRLASLWQTCLLSMQMVHFSMHFARWVKAIAVRKVQVLLDGLSPCAIWNWNWNLFCLSPEPAWSVACAQLQPLQWS